ncbi:MAG TPA: hypothetical protein VND89_10565 [Acidimicrobiales bacterium]|nr:hypothetical protein [Acidimicrobiales bacterium]
MGSIEKTTTELSASNELKRHAVRVLVTTQALFFLALTWCVYLQHGFNARSAGISFFGVNHRTIFFAILGYVIAAVGMWRTSNLFNEGGLGPYMSLGLKLVAVMLLLLLVTPYTGGTFLNWAHMSVGVLGALVQLSITYAVLRRTTSLWAVTGAAVQLVGGILGALSLPDWRFQFLLYGELMFELGFCVCLLQWTKFLVEREAF